jgi:hypothetical protein
VCYIIFWCTESWNSLSKYMTFLNDGADDEGEDEDEEDDDEPVVVIGAVDYEDEADLDDGEEREVV